MQSTGQKYKSINIILLLAIVGLLGIRILLIFSYSLDLDGTEFSFVRYALRLLNNENIYADPTKLPYYSCLIGPVYIYALKFIYYFCGLNAESDLHLVYIVGRTFSFVLFVLHIALFLFYITKRFKINTQQILFLLLVYMLLLSGHVYVIRADGMKLLLFSICFLCLFEYEFYNPKKIYLFAFLFVAILTVFTKHDSIAHLSLLLLALIIVSRKKEYIALLVSFYVLVVIVFGCMSAVFGIHFFTNTILLNIQIADNFFFSINLLFVWLSVLRVLPFIILTIITFNLNKSRILNDIVLRYLFVVIVCLFVIAHFFMLRASSYINYAYECIFILIFFACYLLSKYKIGKLNRFYRLFTVIYIIGLLISTWLIHSYSYSVRKEKKMKQEYCTNIENAAKVKKIVLEDRCFLSNVKYIPYMNNINTVGGYDYYIGRLMEAYLSVESKTHLMFLDATEYNACFTNGTIHYIIGDKEKLIKKYYPLYEYHTKVDNLYIYRFKENN